MNKQEFIEQIDEVLRSRDGAPKGDGAFAALSRTIWALRQPGGCPWDIKQTHESLKKHAIEEAYEFADAVSNGTTDDIKEELGDLLEQVSLNAQVAADEGTFTIEDIVLGLNEKLIRRHPHVFGTPAAPRPGFATHEDVADISAEDVLDIWDSVKADERKTKEKTGLMDSVPVSLPALMRAQKVSGRAAKAGFDWEEIEDIWQQFFDEKREFEAEKPGSAAAKLEFGDMLFCLVNIARREGIDVEEALAASTSKFIERWRAMEALAASNNVDLADLDSAKQNELWSIVKEAEHTNAE